MVRVRGPLWVWASQDETGWGREGGGGYERMDRRRERGESGVKRRGDIRKLSLAPGVAASPAGHTDTYTERGAWHDE